MQNPVFTELKRIPRSFTPWVLHCAPCQPDMQRLMCAQVNGLTELTLLKASLVGLPWLSGLNAEQREYYLKGMFLLAYTLSHAVASFNATPACR